MTNDICTQGLHGKPIKLHLGIMPAAFWGFYCVSHCKNIYPAIMTWLSLVYIFTRKLESFRRKIAGVALCIELFFFRLLDGVTADSVPRVPAHGRAVRPWQSHPCRSRQMCYKHSRAHAEAGCITAQAFLAKYSTHTWMSRVYRPRCSTRSWPGRRSPPAPSSGGTTCPGRPRPRQSPPRPPCCPPPRARCPTATSCCCCRPCRPCYCWWAACRLPTQRPCVRHLLVQSRSSNAISSLLHPLP
jgi:hypothetical protein